jgi:hypothetical protein
MNLQQGALDRFRKLLCWLMAAQILISQGAGWQVSYLKMPPGAKIIVGQPYQFAFRIVDQQNRPVPKGTPVTVDFTGAAAGKRTVETQTEDDDGTVLITGVVAIVTGQISVRITARMPGTTAPMLDQSIRWEGIEAIPPPPQPGTVNNGPWWKQWWGKALIIGGAGAAAGIAGVVCCRPTPDPSPVPRPPSPTITPGTPTIRPPR